MHTSPFHLIDTWGDRPDPSAPSLDLVALVGENPVRAIGRVYQEAFGSKAGMWRWSFYGPYSPPELGHCYGVTESREATEIALAAHWAKWLEWRRANPDQPQKVWKEACLHWPDGKPGESAAE